MITFSRRESMRPLLMGLLLSAPCTVAKTQEAEPQPQMVIQQGHVGIPRLLKFSADSRFLASADESGLTKIWDTASGDLIQTIEGTEWVLSLAFSPDGSKLAIGQNREIGIWDWRRGKSLKVLGQMQSRVVGLAWSPNGRFLAACDGQAFIWDVAVAALVKTLGAREDFDIHELCFSADGQQVATRGSSLRLWNFNTGALERVLSWESSHSMAFLPDGKTLASTRGFHIWPWRLSDGKLLHLPPDNGAGAILLSEDGRKAIGTVEGQELALYDVVSGEIVRQLKGQVEWSFSFPPTDTLKLSADASLLALTAQPTKSFPKFQLWDLKTGQPKFEFPRAIHTLSAPAISEGGKRLVADIGTGIGIWKLDTNVQSHFISVGGNQGQFLRLNRDGKTLYRLGRDQAGGQWLETFDLSPEMPVVKSTSLPLRFWGNTLTADGKQILGTLENKGGSYSLSTGQFSPRAVKFGYDFQAAAPSGEWTVLSSRGQLYLWNLKTDAINLLPGKHPGGIVGVEFSPDGKLVGSRSHDTGAVTLWDVVTRQVVKQLPRTGPTHESFIFSPDSSQVAVLKSGEVLVWNIATGTKELSSPAKHGAKISFSSSGKTLLLSNPNGATQFLDVDSGKLRATLQILVSIPKPGKPNPQPEWILYTPEGYYEASIRGAHAIRWNVDGDLFSWDKFASRFHRPDLVLSTLKEG